MMTDTPHQVAERIVVPFIDRFGLSVVDQAALIEAIRTQVAAAAGDGWKPISEAPKDGTKFWAFDPKREERQFVCWWHDGETRPYYSCWMDTGDTEPEPTHGRHLPEPPLPETAT